MSGYYVLKPSGDHFMFLLKAGNHETILTSQRYTTKAAAQKGIASVQKNGGDDKHFKKLTAKNNAPYFTLNAGNGEIIGTSEMYSTEAAAEKGIASVKTNAASTTVKEVTEA